MSDVIVAPSTRDLDDLARDLEAWLARQMPTARDITVRNLAYPRGAGQSHETVLFDLDWTESGKTQSQGYVVRIKPTWFTVFPDDLFEQQFKVMKALHDGNYVRVARPMWLEPDSTILGAPFFVMEKKVGRVPVSIPPYAKSGWVADATQEQHRRMWESGVRQLAAIQRVPLSAVSFLEGPEGARSGLEQEWDKYVRFVDWVQEDKPWPVLVDALARLKSLWPKNQPEGLVWGDSRLGNMMFDENFDVIAVMDWEQPSLGGALHDLAWWNVLSATMHGPNAMHGGYLPGMGTREETIALWEDVSGKSAADIEWYEDFANLKMACTGVRLDALRGSSMSSPEALAKRLKVA
jgi:aminoglycoside phosphotransferase (APT) family kinase protein